MGTNRELSTKETTTELNRSVLLLNSVNGRISNAPMTITVIREETLRTSKLSGFIAGEKESINPVKVLVIDTL